MFEYFLLSVALGVLSYILAPRPNTPDAKPHSLGDIDVPTADPAKEITVVFGTGWVHDPNVVWYGDLGTTPIESEGGKK